MKWSRRSVLIATAVVVAGCDILLLVRRWQNSAQIFATTYVGMDSLSVIVPASRKAAAFQAGQWIPALVDRQIQATDMGGKKQNLFYVTLGPRSTYAHFLLVVRDLKARGKCNVVIHEGGRPVRMQGTEGDGLEPKLAIPALVLCGRSIGDAGFHGTLPADGIVRLEANS